MKKTLFTLAFLTVFTIDAQITTLAVQRNAQAFMEYVDRYETADNLDYLDEEYTGTPYSNPIFLLGNIYENNKVVASNYALRYNAMLDEVEVKENLYAEDTEIKALAKNPALYAKIMSDMFVYRVVPEAQNGAGYFQVLHIGSTYNLYKKSVKKYYPAIKAQNSFEKDVLAKFSDRPVYYLVSQDGIFQEFGPSKNKRLRLFESKQTEMKKLVKLGKLDLTQEKDLLRAVKHYDIISSKQ